MAYLDILLSAPESQVKALQADSRRLLRPSSRVVVSHQIGLIGWAIDAEPLALLLGEAVDGGKPLSRIYKHPLREPVYHDPGDVAILSKKLDQAWVDAKARAADVDESAHPYAELVRLLKLYRHASARGECVISVLLPPDHVDGYEWVKMPFAAESATGGRDETDRLGMSLGVSHGSLLAWAVGSIGGVCAVGVALGIWRFLRFRKRADPNTDGANEATPAPLQF